MTPVVAQEVCLYERDGTDARDVVVAVAAPRLLPGVQPTAPHIVQVNQIDGEWISCCLCVVMGCSSKKAVDQNSFIEQSIGTCGCNIEKTTMQRIPNSNRFASKEIKGHSEVFYCRGCFARAGCWFMCRLRRGAWP